MSRKKGHLWCSFLLLAVACTRPTSEADDDVAIRTVLVNDFHHALVQMGPINRYVVTPDSAVADEMVLHLSPPRHDANRRHAVARIRVTCGDGCGSVEDAYLAKTGDKWIVVRRQRVTYR